MEAQLIGIAASIFTAIALLPQLIKLLREKNGEHVSIGMLAILFIGLVLWIIYGVLQEDNIIVVSNSFSLLVNSTILLLSLKYKRNS